MGIFDLIQLSRQGPKYHNEMIIAALHFWNPSTSSLHLKCGMLTPTLLDVAGLTSLKPIGQTFDPDSHVSELTFDFPRPAYGIFITDHHVTSSPTVSDKEHIAFLTYWLSMYIFCSRSIQIPKKFTTLAIHLHEGKDVCLGKLILGSLYENLNQAVASIKEYQAGCSLIIPGPIWLFQLWILATFRTKLAITLPSHLTKAYEARSIEGIWLAMLQYGNRSSVDLFSITYNVLLNCHTFTPLMAPFVIRDRGTIWFKRPFPAQDNDDEAEINQIWEAYLTPTFLSSRITSGSPYGLYGYQPNHAARQFGLIQPKPCSLYQSVEDLRQPLLEQVWRSAVRRAEKQRFTFEPVAFTPSYACTVAFHRWWQDYYDCQSNRINPSPLLPQMILAFHAVQKNTKKNKGTHIREIQAFQKYFQTVYDPIHLSRTVNNAAQTLRDKIYEKIPIVKFPPYTPNKYRFTLDSKMKFPALPTSELALAFRPPYPKWLYCMSSLGMRQHFLKREEDKVVWAKQHLYNFRGHLHLDLPHIRIISEMGIGMNSFRFNRTT